MTEPRFLRLSDVAEILNISAAQTYALVRSGDLAGMKIGGRGQWRVERGELESFIKRAHDQTRAFVEAHPFGRDDAADEGSDLSAELRQPARTTQSAVNATVRTPDT
jgi:excisionase family DNA binding protein